MGRYFPDLPPRTLSQMGDVKDNPVHLVAEEVYAKWPVAFLWGRSSGTSGEHPKGLALDFSVLAYGGGVNNPGPANPAMGDAIAAYLWRHRVRLGVWYVIWNRRIISRTYESQGWRAYTGSSPHTDHVHVSFYSDPVYQPPAQPEPQPEDDIVATRAELRADIRAELDRFLHEADVPNINEPGGAAVNQGSIAGHLSNIEGTQDAMYRNQRSMLAQVGSLNATVAELGKALAAHAGSVDVDQLVAAVRGASEAGALAALQGVVDVRVTVDTDTNEE